MNRFALPLGASALGLLVFIGAMHLHFPSEAVVERARYAVQDGSKGKWALEASDASWWMPGGVTLSDVTVFRTEGARRRPSADESGPIPGSIFMRSDSVSARVALLPLLSGQQMLDFVAEAWGGDLSGRFGEADGMRLVTLHTDGIDLARIPIEGEEWSVDASGLLKLDADLKLPLERGRDAPAPEGSILLEISDLVIKESRMMGMDLVAATFTEAVLELEMAGKKAEVQRGRFASDVIDLTIGGHMNVSAGDPSRWRLRLELEFTLDDQLDTMAKLLPTTKSARGEDGTYHMLCSGTLSSPSCKADRSKVRGGRVGRPSLGNVDKEADDAPRRPRRKPTRSRSTRSRDDDADARREERRRRLEERRARLRAEREDRGDPPFDNGPDIELPLDEPRPPRGFEPNDDFGDEEFEEEFPPPPDFEEPRDLDEELPEIGYIDD